MLSVVTWQWHGPKGYRSTFGPQTVNVLRRMTARHYHQPHRFICVTDDATGLDPEVEVIPSWDDFADVMSPHGNPQRYPSCYRRLRAFHPQAAEWFGPRLVSLDLDCVITGDVTPLWDRPEDFVIWGDTQRNTLYNASMYLLTCGTRSQVWERFDPRTSPAQARAAGNHGSDQAWISYCLGKGEARWTAADGVRSFRNEIAPHPAKALPPGTRITFWHGAHDPWGPVGQAIPWVQEHWR